MEAVIAGAAACRAAAGAAISVITAAAEADGGVVATVGTGVDADRTPGAEAGEADTAGPEDVWAATFEAT